MNCLNVEAWCAVIAFACQASGADPFREDTASEDSGRLPVASVDWNESGQGLLVAQWNKVLLFDTKTKAVTTIYDLRDRETMEEDVAEARFAGDGFAVLDNRHVVILLDAKGRRVWKSGKVDKFAISSTGEQLATIDSQRWITVYRLTGGVPRQQHRWQLIEPSVSPLRKRHRYFQMLHFCADDQKLVGSISWMGQSKWFVAGVKEGRELAWYPGAVFAGIQLNYPYLATMFYPNCILVRDLRNGKEAARFVGAEFPPLTTCWVSSRAEWLVAAHGTLVRLIDIDAKEAKVLKEWKLDSSVSHILPLCSSRTSNSIAIGTCDGNVLLFDCDRLQFTGTLSCESEAWSDRPAVQTRPK